MEPPVPREPPSIPVLRVKKRSPNWLPDEEEQLAISWIRVSQIPEFESKQTGDGFYLKVTEDFNKHSRIHQRDAAQIQTRWAGMNTATLRFSVIYNLIEREPPSGSSPSDWVVMAKRLYQEQKGHPFKLQTAWEVLRRHPKWLQDSPTPPRVDPPADPRVGPSAYASSASDGESSTPVTPSRPEPERPPGAGACKRKRVESEALAENEAWVESEAWVENERRKLRQAARLNDIAEQRVELMIKANEIAKDRLAIEQRERDLEVMMKTPDDFPNERGKEFLLLLQRRVLDRYKQKEGHQNDD